MHFRVKIQNGGYFFFFFFLGGGGGGGGVLKFQIFLGCLQFLIFFLGGGVNGLLDAEPEPTYEEKNECSLGIQEFWKGGSKV